MRRADLVIPIGDQESQRHGVDATDEEAQHVDGGRVHPVQVLDRQDTRPGPQSGVEVLADAGERQVLTGQPLCDADLPADVPERAERARRPQRVAAAPENAEPVCRPARRMQEDRLAGARISCQGHP